MKKWIIKSLRVGRNGTVISSAPWVFGKRGAGVPESEVTDEWLYFNGFGSEGAAKRQVFRLPYREVNPGSRIDACLEGREVPYPKLTYKIYRCYEIVILDGEGNQIGESDYVYTDRKDAEEQAKHKLGLAISETSDPSPQDGFQVGRRYASEMLPTIEIIKRKGNWIWFKKADGGATVKRKVGHWGGECEVLSLSADHRPGYDWLSINEEEGC